MNNINLYRNVDPKPHLVCPVEDEHNRPVDLTGWTVSFGVCEDDANPKATILTLGDGAGLTVRDNVVYPDMDRIFALPDGRYHFTLLGVTGEVTNILAQGTLRVSDRLPLLHVVKPSQPASDDYGDSPSAFV